MEHAANPHANFRDFVAVYKPHVRPEQTLSRLERAFGIDVEFIETFRLLRPYLKRSDFDFADIIVKHVSAARSADGVFDANNSASFAYIYKRHSQQLLSGRFDAEYLSSIEDVALFMAFHDIKSVWLSGAYQKIFEEVTRQIFEATEKHRLKMMERVVCLWAKVVAIEMNQAQRTLTMLEIHRLQSLLDDFQFTGALKSALKSKRNTPSMAISEHDVAIVQKTFRKIAPQSDLFAKKFYERLFDIEPSLASMFPSEMSAQRRKLMQTLAVTIEGMRDLDALLPEIADLGRRHRAYQVRRRQYDTVGEAMLWTLERGLGTDWNDEVRAAWAAAYGALSQTMQNAANE